MQVWRDCQCGLGDSVPARSRNPGLGRPPTPTGSRGRDRDVAPSACHGARRTCPRSRGGVPTLVLKGNFGLAGEAADVRRGRGLDRPDPRPGVDDVDSGGRHDDGVEIEFDELGDDSSEASDALNNVLERGGVDGRRAPIPAPKACRVRPPTRRGVSPDADPLPLQHRRTPRRRGGHCVA